MLKRVGALLVCGLTALALIVGDATAKDHAKIAPITDARGPAGATVVLVRHAEKPDAGPGLSPAGEVRARNYADYFRRFQVDGRPLTFDTLVATADSKNSARPRLTITPLSQALGLPIEHGFANADVAGMVRWLDETQQGRTVLISWHHGMMPTLLANLGVEVAPLIPGGKWPGAVFDWVIVLKFDAQGRVVDARRIVEPAAVGQAKGN